MFDDYQVPAAALVTALLLAFGYLDHHFRSARIRLWLLAMLCVEVHSLFFWRVSNSHSTILPWAFSGDLSPSQPWMAVVAEVALMLCSALFLASLSPLSFRIGKLRVLYVVPYTIPLILYSILVYTFGRVPGHLFWVYVALAACTLVSGLTWSVARGTLPVWLSTLIVAVAAIVQHSRFTRTALVARTSQDSFTLIGASGMDGATIAAVDALAQRLTPEAFDLNGPRIAPESNTLDLDLTPWLTPGDDLERLRLTRVGAVPMLGPEHTVEGAILLSGLRHPEEEPRADDLLPIEALAGRIQAARSQALMLGKLIDSERFAGVGQLATNVAQQLNNPLTVILGYAAILQDAVAHTQDARAAETILVEARRMKALLERIAMFSRHSTERYATYSISDLMADMEQLHRMEFLTHAIDFHMRLAPNLPELVGNAHQVRQSLMHALQWAIESVERLNADQVREVRLEATPSKGGVCVLIGHSGRGFVHPERAFDSLSTGVMGTDATTIGLSLCAAIIREHQGDIEAVNLEPYGAAVLLELPSN